MVECTPALRGYTILTQLKFALRTKLVEMMKTRLGLNRGVCLALAARSIRPASSLPQIDKSLLARILAALNAAQIQDAVASDAA
jgi:hypothetical protein